MNETARLIRSRTASIEPLVELRETCRQVFSELGAPDVRESIACVEDQVFALIDNCRAWLSSPQRVAIVTELETLAQSFSPRGRIRGLDQLKDETIAALLDDAPGGQAIIAAGRLDKGNFEIPEAPLVQVGILTNRDRVNAHLIQRLSAQNPERPDDIAAAAVYASPALSRKRLASLFAGPDAPGRGSLTELKKSLTKPDRQLVAESAKRAAAHLRIAFRMWDKRTDHQRGGTIENWIEPTPFARLVVTLMEFVAPAESKLLFHNSAGQSDKVADAVLALAAEARNVAQTMIGETPELEGLDVLCGIDVARIVNDLNKNAEPIEEAVRRFVGRITAMRDDVLLIEGYRNTLNAYTDEVADRLDSDGKLPLDAALDRVVRDICKPLGEWRHELRADIRDGVVYVYDIGSRATGESRPHSLLPNEIRRIPTRFISTIDYGSVALPENDAPIHMLVREVADQDILSAWQQLQEIDPVSDFLVRFGNRPDLNWT